MEYCKHKNSFCYICGHFIAKRNQRKRSEMFVVWYRAAYDDAEWIDEIYAPSVGCAACYSSLKRCFHNEQNQPKYRVPMTWNNPGEHNPSTCYFCANIASGVNTIKSQTFDYQHTPYVDLPAIHAGITPPMNVDLEQQDDDEDDDMDDDATAGPYNMDNDDFDFDFGGAEDIRENVREVDIVDDVSDMDVADDIADNVTASTSSYAPPLSCDGNISRKLISQPRLNNMCRRLALTQRKSRLLAKMLREDCLLLPGVKIRTQSRQAEFEPYFTKDSDADLAYCSNIRGLMEKLKIVYEVDEWRLFIDGSKSGLKAVLLHNDGAYSPIPIAYTRTLKETYASMKLIFEKIKYHEHEWDVSGDLKVVALIMGLQLGRTRNSCFICTWISTAKIDHYHATWEHRSEYIIGEMNVKTNSLVPREKILLPTLHIKLGLITQFVKKLEKDSDAFKYLAVLFPKLSKAKINAGKIILLYFDRSYLFQYTF